MDFAFIPLPILLESWQLFYALRA